MTPDERWKELSDSLSHHMGVMRNDAFRAGRIATLLGKHLRNYVGAKDGKCLLWYSYKPAYDARYDEFKECDSGYEAVSKLEDGRWGYAYREIRNEFGHQRAKLHFDSPEIEKLAKKLSTYNATQPNQTAIQAAMEMVMAPLIACVKQATAELRGQA